MVAAKSIDALGPYRVVRQIGSGGMASIFEAVDTRLGHVAGNIVGDLQDHFHKSMLPSPYEVEAMGRAYRENGDTRFMDAALTRPAVLGVVQLSQCPGLGVKRSILCVVYGAIVSR